MIPLHHAEHKKYALFGLGGSGLATAKALVAGGAKVIAYDDNDSGRDAAKAVGLTVDDLRNYDFKNFDGLVLSPGVPLTHPLPHWSAQLATSAGIEVIGDIELFCRERRFTSPHSKLVAITGTNGKSTTTALCAHVLSTAQKKPVMMGGNIGRAALDLELGDNQITVLECSSYQIDLAPSLDADIAILLNLSEDHLDRHGDMAHYGAVKARLVENVRDDGMAIVGVDDDFCAKIAKHLRAIGKPLTAVSIHHKMPDGIWLNGTTLYHAPDGTAKVLIDLSTCPALRGTHNAQNAAAVFAAALALGLPQDAIVSAMRSFSGLAHRMQRIGTVGNVAFINDSKATNADAAAKALASFYDIFWIAGGRAKSGGIQSLNTFFPNIIHAYLIGEAAKDFAATLQGQVEVTMAETVDNAVMLAARDALKSGRSQVNVLFSPACASFDQFKNFEARGEAFVAAAQKLDGFQKA